MIIEWLRKQVKDASKISASKQEGRIVREDKSNATARLMLALQKLDNDPEREISLSREHRHGAD